MTKAYVYINTIDTTVNKKFVSTSVNCRSILSNFKSKYVRISMKNAIWNMSATSSASTTLNGVDVWGLWGLNVEGLNVKSTGGTVASRSIMRLYSDGNITCSATGTSGIHNWLSMSVGADEDNGVIFETEYLRNINGIAMVSEFDIYGGIYTVSITIDDFAGILEISSVEEEDI